MPQRHLFTLPPPEERPDYAVTVRRALARAPRPARLALLAIPLVVALYASAPALWERAGQAFRGRAAFEVLEDFRKGVKHWRGATDWTRSPDGMVSIGKFAVLDASRALRDYDFEFLGQIKSRGIGWVFRASDAQNYYGGELVVRKPGPVPEFALRRYSVIAGKRQDLAEVALPRLMHNDTPYRILVRVRGDSFATFVEGQMVDSWTDSRLTDGGVGFGASKEDRAYLYWVKITYQNDWLGRLCARLAPASQGSTE